MKKTLVLLLFTFYFAMAKDRFEHQYFELTRKSNQYSSISLDTVNSTSYFSRGMCIGVQLGYHSKNLSKTYRNLSEGLHTKILFNLPISNRVDITMAYDYWQTWTKESKYPDFRNEDVLATGRGLKVGIELYIAQISQWSVITGISLGDEHIDISEHSPLGLNFSIGFLRSIYKQDVFLAGQLWYQYATGLNLGGGGFSYSFTGLSISLRFDVTKTLLHWRDR